MKPESNTETVASARDFSSPLTLIRIDAFRGSDTSCIDCAMAQPCNLAAFLATLGPSCPATASGLRYLDIHRASRPQVQTLHQREALGGFLFDAPDEILDVP